MISVIGTWALSFAAALALINFVLPTLGVSRGKWRLVKLAAPLTYMHGIFLFVSFGALVWAFVNDAFYIRYVASHSNTALPLPYKVAGTWGGHEGSLLLWTMLLVLWMMAVSFFSRGLPGLTRARVLAILSAIAFGFDAFILVTSNPFSVFPHEYPLDGADLNPLLQDPGLVVHPPMLYMGYVGFSVAFAFSLAAMLEGRIDSLWARWVRPWTLAAWMFLTLGITLGSWWAYYELGWGGWWFWDPVENASFMPWLVGAALIHSLAATEKRGVFKAWTTLLAITAFSFSLLGTFLVRSGVLTSVHAFANDPVRGTYILIFLGVVVGTSMFIFAVRAHAVSVHAWFDYLSRETLFLLNNLLLAVATFAVLFGTLQPIIAEAMNAGKVSVGPPYFNFVFNVLMVPLLFLIGIGPLSRWRTTQVQALWNDMRWSAASAFVLAAALAYLVPRRMQTVPWQVGLGVFLSAWIVLGQSVDLFKRSSALRRVRSIGASHWGMYLAHVGVAATVFGVVMVSHLDVEKNLRVAAGQKVVVAGYQFVFKGTRDIVGPNYQGTQGVFHVLDQAGRTELTLYPEKRTYSASGRLMTEAAIDWGLMRDLYIALGEPMPDGSWTIRIYVKPFVRWIWLGGLMMALGALIALVDRRYRKTQKLNIAEAS
ncbi:MAG: heme lyase CcmF/NrfE family subunit [Gammaproteobacteria bacterium]|nr:MAG: heme lyase CcmF/NrfE family subunit [Gammaproteobacteria bacterium]